MSNQFGIGERVLSSDVTGDRQTFIDVMRRAVTPPHVQVSFPPTWGVSRLRDTTDTTDGGTVDENEGRIRLRTSTGANDAATLYTRERGHYRDGTWGDASLGIRVPNAGSLEDGQEITFGYYDKQNGFGYGVDATGPFVFRYRAGSRTITRPASWYGPAGQSAFMDALADGAVFHTLFRWYGHGPALWFAEKKNTGTQWTDETAFHQSVYTGTTSIVDPNQPLRVDVTNGGVTSNPLSVFVGGRQFALYGNTQAFNTRPVSVPRRGYALGTKSATNDWEPIIAVRKKQTILTRNNSVRVVHTGVKARTDGDVEIMVTFDATVTATWAEIEDHDGDETDIEADVGDFTVSAFGQPVEHVLGGGSFFFEDVIESAARIPMGDDTVCVLWVRGSGVTVSTALMNFELQR